MTESQARSRSLSKGEEFMLAQIQDIYGPQNAESDVFFSDQDEAAIFVKDRAGASIGLVVLTNLAQMYEDGTITSLEELRLDWLRVGA
jgi:hypothetical protein